MVWGYRVILAISSVQWDSRRKQRESSPLATPFVLQLKVSVHGVCDSHVQPAVLSERGWTTSLVPPPIDGNVASRSKPFHRFLVIDKLYLLWETNKKQSICWKILSTLYPPNLPLLPLNFPESPWWTPNGWFAKHFVLWDGVCPWVCERPRCCWVARQ